MKSLVPRGRKLKVIVIAVLGVCCLLVGTCALLVSQVNLVDRKSEHAFPLPGSDPLTDEQASTFAHQILLFDKRDVTSVVLEGVTRDVTTTQATNASPTFPYTVTFRDRKTGWFW